jgi:hypothetical protein
LVVLGFEFRALCFLGRHSTVWDTIFALVNLERGFCSWPGQPGLQSSCCMLPMVLGMTGASHLMQTLYPHWPRTVILLISASWVVWDDKCKPPCPTIDWHGVSWTFCPGCPQTATLPISASQLARIIGKSHWHPAKYIFNWKVH